MPSELRNSDVTFLSERQINTNAINVAIKIENLSKSYHLYDNPKDRLKQSIYPRLQKALFLPTKHYYKEYWALKNISLEIKKGETIGILGKNGAGKSTLLQIICGTLQPSQGYIEKHGKVAALLELGSGFNPDFTGLENIFMNATILGLSQKEIHERLPSIINFADIGDFLYQPVKTYSSGMVVRLAFSIVTQVDADILIVDEALAVGDAFFVQKCMRFLRDFMGQGTLIFVSHDTGSVVNLCNRAIWLDKGEIVASGSPKSITESYLENLYETSQGKSEVKKNTLAPAGKDPYRDMRQDFINRSNLRNDIEVFKFCDKGKQFGKGGAQITSVSLQDKNGISLAWVVGGESVKLIIQCQINTPISNAIVGFQVKDHLGQVIFADNTYLTYRHSDMAAMPGDLIAACFSFVMPVMPVGDYTISTALADGSQVKHIQHHWIHDALAFKVHSTSVCFGLIGVPMNNIELKKL